MREELEIYKIYVRTIIATENRRQRAATAYLSIIAAIATVSSIIGDIPLVVPIGAIIFVALIWLATVYYFRRLAKAKFSVISSIEPILPIQPFKEEWKHFKKGGYFNQSRSDSAGNVDSDVNHFTLWDISLLGIFQSHFGS